MKIFIPNIGKVVVYCTENYQPSFRMYNLYLFRIFPINRPETQELNLPFYCICSDIRNRYRDPACN